MSVHRGGKRGENPYNLWKGGIPPQKKSPFQKNVSTFPPLDLSSPPPLKLCIYKISSLSDQFSSKPPRNFYVIQILGGDIWFLRGGSPFSEMIISLRSVHRGGKGGENHYHLWKGVNSPPPQKKSPFHKKVSNFPPNASQFPPP